MEEWQLKLRSPLVIRFVALVFVVTLRIIFLTVRRKREPYPGTDPCGVPPRRNTSPLSRVA